MRSPHHRGERLETRIVTLEKALNDLRARVAPSDLGLRVRVEQLSERTAELERVIVRRANKLAFNRTFPYIPGGPQRHILETLYHCSPEFHSSKEFAYTLYNRPGIKDPQGSVESAIMRTRKWLRQHHPDWQIIGKHRVGYCLVREDKP